MSNKGILITSLIVLSILLGVFTGLEKKWRAFMDVKADFERRIGGSIYDLFPEAVANTFGKQKEHL